MERDLRKRIVEQFSGDGDRADIWRGFGLCFDTDAYLNLGYSGRCQTHLLGEPQARLVSVVLTELASHQPALAGSRLLDVGCGRGKPTVWAAERYGVDAIGVDLVSHNVRRAIRHADTSDRSPAFVLGDAARLPLASDSVSACVAVDSLVYVAEKADAFEEIGRVLEPGGHLVCSDLVVHDEAAVDGTVDRFGREWDMPAPPRFADYIATVEKGGLTVEGVRDLSPHSIGGFRKWSGLYLALAEGPTAPALALLARGLDLDPGVITEQVRAAHEALPALHHVLVTASR